MEKNCEKCKWHRKGKNTGERVCVRFTSELYGEETAPKDSCDKWEKKQEV